MNTDTQFANPTVRIGIVGGGFAGLMAYTVLRFRGVAESDIAVFTTDTSPEDSWARLVRAINQKKLRSESMAHFFPTDSPGLATLEAMKGWSIKPILQSWFDRYHPTVDFMIDHIQRIACQSRFYQSRIICTVAAIQKNSSGFGIVSDRGETIATVQHLIVAIGHGPLSFPSVIRQFRLRYPLDRRVRHAFSAEQPATPPQATIVVLGSGLTAATQWATLLERGYRVIALCPDGFPMGQPLNTPRRYFSRRGLTPFRRQAASHRVHELRRATRGTVPAYPEWQRLFKKARQDGRLLFIQGMLDSLQATSTTLQCLVRQTPGHALYSFGADQVVVATGFQPATSHPLLMKLIQDFHLPTHEAFLVADNHCRLPSLSSKTQSAFVIGPAAAWVIPCADSIGGMKIAAHRIADTLLGRESWTIQELWHKTRQWYTVTIGHGLS